jgi:hypothetical protein
MKVKKHFVILMICVLASCCLLTGCGGSNASITKAFILNTCVYSVDEDAMPIMNKMEAIQKEANEGKEVEETYVMSLYVKADKNKNGKISKGEAEKAYKKYLAEIRVVIGAIPFQIPGS